MNTRKATAPRVKPAPAARGASRSTTRSRLNIRAWREHHAHSFFSSLARIAARPGATALTVLVMGLALALPLLLFLLLQNVQGLSTGWQEAREITVFLKPEIEAPTAKQFAENLRARSDVAIVKIRTPDEGLAEFRSQSGFSDALKVLQANPLPTVLVVTARDNPRDKTNTTPELVGQLKSDPKVDLVQYDAAWRQRLGAILTLGERVVQVLAALLALGTLLVVGNTVRLDIQSRAAEIGTLQLLGASKGFVRRPFLYIGLWYGLLSGFVALLLVLAVQLALGDALAHLLSSYDNRFAFSALGWIPALLVLVVSAALGWFGAWLVASRHLAVGQPA